MRSAPVLLVIAPLAGVVRTSVPLTYSLSDVPSYVTAMCVQALTAVAADAGAARSPPLLM
jgi:hypothetical protein